MQSYDKVDLKISASLITEVNSWLEIIRKRFLNEDLNLKMETIERRFMPRKISDKLNFNQLNISCACI